MCKGEIKAGKAGKAGKEGRKAGCRQAFRDSSGFVLAIRLYLTIAGGASAGAHERHTPWRGWLQRLVAVKELTLRDRPRFLPVYAEWVVKKVLPPACSLRVVVGRCRVCNRMRSGMAVLTLFYSEMLCESFVVAELNDHHTVPPPARYEQAPVPGTLVATTPLVSQSLCAGMSEGRSDLHMSSVSVVVSVFSPLWRIHLCENRRFGKK